METANKTDTWSIKNKNLCRVCLSSDKENKCIFTFRDNLHPDYSFIDLWKQLQLYGDIEISQGDGLPTKMCDECICKMHVAHEFRMQCQSTDKLLRSIDRNIGNLKYMTSDALRDTKIRIEYVKNHEIKQSENLSSSESNVNAQIELSSLSQIPKNSENKIFSCTDSVENQLAVDAKFSQARTILVLKKIDDNIDENASETHKSHASEKTESKNFQPVLQEFINDKSGDVCKEKEDKSVLKKDEHRSRRLTLFKRATSMTNLKNNKERQRQYIKKNLLTKYENSDQDNVQKNKSSGAKTRKTIVTDSSLSHKCSKCGRAYSSKTTLESHERTHDLQKLSCNQCNERFQRLDDFLKHTKTHDLNEKLKPASCKLCNKNFRKAVTMVRHLNVHKRENPRAVYSILKDIRDRKRRKHLKISGENRENSENEEENIVLHDSQEFSKTTSDSQENRDRVSEIIRADSNSEEDTKSFNKRSGDKTKADELNSPIEHCMYYQNNVSWEQSPPDERSAIKLINIWIKEELDSDNEGKGFPCEYCSKSYTTKKSLSKHQEKIHANTNEEFCPRCGEDCTCTDRMKENRKKTQEKSFMCEECNKTFENEVKLEKHLRIHARAKEQQDTNFKRFLCHICSKTFRQNTGLMFHMRTHTGYKPHVCKYCGRGFTSNSNCINHERTHTGDRPFVCHFCSAAFAKSCTLKAHITTHTGEANYHCKTCGKSFRRLKYLKEHRFTHTGEKPYACKICGTAYSHSGSLFVHEKKCKAQEGNYQAVSVPVNYRQQPVTETIAASSITPIINSMPSSHHVRPIGAPLTPDVTKSYIDSIPRISSLTNSISESVEAHIHMNPDNADVTSADRSFAIVGQIFHT